MTRRLIAPDDGLGRVEDGPVRFGDDWTGTFIRGDSSRGYALRIAELLGVGLDIPGYFRRDLEALRDLLNKCYGDEKNAREAP